MKKRLDKKGLDISYLSELEDIFGIKKNKKEVKEKDNIEYLPENDLYDDFFKVTNSEVKLNQIIMSSKLKEEVNLLISEFLNKNLLEKIGLYPDNKILLYGPSGCGKTLLAYGIANKLGKKLFIVNLSTIIDSGLGKTSTKIFQLFQNVSFNKGILFFDEIDMLGKKRDDLNDHGELKRVATSILQALDFMDKDILFIGATNYPDIVDTALLRRFNRKIEFSLPNKSQISKYIANILKELKIEVKNTGEINKLANDYKGLSFAETRDSFIIRVKRYIIKHKDFNYIDLKML